MSDRAPLELSEAAAASEAPRTAARLAEIALNTADRENISHHRYWCEAARTYTCHTCTAIHDQDDDSPARLSELFYHAATMDSQAWYPEFQGGYALPTTVALDKDTLRQHRTSASFDLHVGKARSYRQLLSEHSPNADMWVLVARSITDPDHNLALDGVLAYTPAQNGEVFEWRDGTLYWHHICTTPGPRILPGPLDRWLINGLRRFGLDQAERNTYEREALMLREWISNGALSA